MEGIISEIMNEVYREEQKANQLEYVGNAKEIRIHPNQFHVVMEEDKFQMYVQCNRITGLYALCGIPIYRDPTIEKWKVFV